MLLEASLPPDKVRWDQWDDLPMAASSRRINALNILMRVNLLVFVLMVAFGIPILSPTPEQLLRWGADYGPLTFGGQYWRLITSSFLHFNIDHLLVNLFFLWRLGRLLERVFGPWVTFGAYLFTGGSASLIITSWQPMAVSAGASGAIYGFAGILIAYFAFGKLDLPKRRVKNILLWVVLLIFLVGAIDLLMITILLGFFPWFNMAHVGGFIAGFLMGLVLARKTKFSEEAMATAG